MVGCWRRFLVFFKKLKIYFLILFLLMEISNIIKNAEKNNLEYGGTSGWKRNNGINQLGNYGNNYP